MSESRSRWVHVGLCALYLPLTVWATWPVAPHAATDLVDTVQLQGMFGQAVLADTLAFVWTLAWGAHALSTDPLSFLDGNIFFPAAWSNARSDHLLGDVVLSAPVYLVSGNPVLGHQTALLLTFVLAAVSAYAAVWWCLGRADAAFVAGLLFGLSPSRFAPLAHVQTLGTMYLPLVVASGMAALARGGLARWASLAAALVLQALCSAHLAALGFVTAGATLLGWWAGPGGVTRARAWRYLAASVAAAALAGVAYLPAAWLQRAGDIPAAGWQAQEMVAASPLASYLPPLLRGGAPGSLLSLPAVLLALVGVAALRDPSGRFAGAPCVGRLRAVALAIGITGWVLSLGPTLRFPGGLAVPLPFRALAFLPALRAPARFGTLVALGASLLAAVGVSALGAGRRRTGAAVAVAAVLLLAVEHQPLRLSLRPLETGARVPPVYRRLAEVGRADPVLELPVGNDSLDFGAMNLQARYSYFSTYHWRPLLNGHGAYPPDSFFFLMAIARRLPAADALQDLVDLTGLRWIVLHGAARDPARAAGWTPGEVAGLGAAERLGDDLLFPVQLAPRRDLRADVSRRSTDEVTLSGAVVRPLGPEARRGTLRDLVVAAGERRGLTYQGWVTVENRSDAVWPGFRARAAGLVHVGYRWLDPGGGQAPDPPRLSRIPTDLAPGASVRVPFAVAPPARPGAYRLHVTLVQKDGAWFDDAGGPDIETVVEVRP
jgi:hypothetical protein